MVKASGDCAIHWPVRARPVVRVVGRFPLSARDFAFIYRTSTHAIHLHDYAGSIRLRGRTFALEPGALTFSPAGEDSAYDLPAPGVHWCIHFDRGTLASTKQPRVKLPLVAMLGPRQQDAAGRFAHIARLHSLAQHGPRNRQAIAREACATALQDLLLWMGLMEELGQLQGRQGHHPAVDALLDLIERRLHRPVSMPELAQEVGVSQNYLARLFRQQMGVTIPHHLLRRRMEIARQLLGTTNMPVKQVAHRVGMPDAQHFNKQFRRLMGMSPINARSAAGGAVRPGRWMAGQ